MNIPNKPTDPAICRRKRQFGKRGFSSYIIEGFTVLKPRFVRGNNEAVMKRQIFQFISSKAPKFLPVVLALLAVGTLALATPAFAQLDGGPGIGVEAGDFRIAEFTERLFSLIEGNLGALIMVVAGIAAIVSAAFGAFRAAVSLLAVAVGAFILRSLVEIFFNYNPPPM